MVRRPGSEAPRLAGQSSALDRQHPYMQPIIAESVRLPNGCNSIFLWISRPATLTCRCRGGKVVVGAATRPEARAEPLARLARERASEEIQHRFGGNTSDVLADPSAELEFETTHQGYRYGTSLSKSYPPLIVFVVGFR